MCKWLVWDYLFLFFFFKCVQGVPLCNQIFPVKEFFDHKIRDLVLQWRHHLVRLQESNPSWVRDEGEAEGWTTTDKQLHLATTIVIPSQTLRVFALRDEDTLGGNSARSCSSTQAVPHSVSSAECTFVRFSFASFSGQSFGKVFVCIRKSILFAKK